MKNLAIKEGYFLPYQVRWLKDKSRYKIWKKSRRIGATYVQSFEDVQYCVEKPRRKVYFSSADESAAKEYIDYCRQWCEIYKIAAEYTGEEIIDPDKDITALAVRFKNGSAIYALTSNPKRFRSKGGKVILDEFAWHEDQKALWDAARPSVTWGYPLRILSTYNGKGNLYYRFIEDVKQGRLNWSLHSTPIQLAVAEGLADRIMGRTLTEKERQAWLEEERRNCGDETTWLQEYCCIPVDESTAFLSYEMITKCERGDILMPLEEIAGDLYVGMDIGRKKDLSVIWGIERQGERKITRIYKELEKAPFHVQRDALFEILSHPSMRRACIDATGLGMQLAEEAQLAFGKFRVEAITFTNKVKEELAYNVRTNFEDVNILIPAEHEIREDLHSVRKVTTASGNIRFDVAASDASGHADRFWALALALHAANTYSGPIYIATRRRRQTAKITRGY